MTLSRIVSGTVLAVALMVGRSEASTILFTQAYGGGSSLFASQNDTGVSALGNFATLYDNFTIPGASTITGVEWTGGFWNPAEEALITSFTIQFYADDSGPGASVFSQTVAFTSTSLGFSDGIPMFSYQASINSFAVNAGQQYWVSIVPNVPYPPQWGWVRSADGLAFQDFLGNRSQLIDDMAFTLTGDLGTASVPEPTTLGLVALGAAVLLLRRSS